MLSLGTRWSGTPSRGKKSKWTYIDKSSGKSIRGSKFRMQKKSNQLNESTIKKIGKKTIDKKKESR